MYCFSPLATLRVLYRVCKHSYTGLNIGNYLHSILEGSTREGDTAPAAGTAARTGEHGRRQQLLQLWRRREQRLSGTPLIVRLMTFQFQPRIINTINTKDCPNGSKKDGHFPLPEFDAIYCHFGTSRREIQNSDIFMAI